jgi:hypothetical protein
VEAPGRVLHDAPRLIAGLERDLGDELLGVKVDDPHAIAIRIRGDDRPAIPGDEHRPAADRGRRVV